MNRRSLMQFTVLAGAAALLSGCFGSRVYSWKQKLVVVVQTPEGEKTASAVSEISASLGLNMNGGGKMASLSLKGEATVVDLGHGKFLFALLNEDSKYLTEYAFARPKDQGAEEFWGRLEASTGSSAPVPGGHYPILVTFDNLSEPKSVKEVKPSDLAATFGAGYALKSITLEITDEKVTEGKVRTIIPWISDFRNKLLDGDTVMWGGDRHTLANSLGMGSFDSN
jgi:hypothetical protein